MLFENLWEHFNVTIHVLDHVGKCFIIDLMDHVDNIVGPCLHTEGCQDQDQEVKNTGAKESFGQVLKQNITRNTTDISFVLNQCNLDS